MFDGLSDGSQEDDDLDDDSDESHSASEDEDELAESKGEGKDSASDDDAIIGEDVEDSDDELLASQSGSNSEGTDEESFEGEDDEESEGHQGPLKIKSDTAGSKPLSDGQSTGKYIPPALRRQIAGGNQEIGAGTSASVPNGIADPSSAGIRRQIKGLLNRMGEGNLESIITQIEAIYQSNSRATVTNAITSVVLDSMTASNNLADTFVVLYAALIASLHKVIGVEFAATLIQALIDDLLAAYQSANAESARNAAYDDPHSKRALSLCTFLCELYNLQVIAAPLIYDLIRHFSGANLSTDGSLPMTELSVELLLKVVKLCGSQLRHDDATSLRDIVDLVEQQMNASAKKQALSSRSRFMLEMLNDMKSNKGLAKKNAGNTAAGESIARMKKLLGGLGKKRTIRAHDSLRVTLRDLQDAEKKGKWWLVGAAWKGHADDEKELVTGVTALRSLASKKQSMSTEDDGSHATRQRLLEYARKHGMNTETRRSIFLTIMTSEDFVDASQKLLELKLNEMQRRDIVRVLLQCLDIVSEA